VFVLKNHHQILRPRGEVKPVWSETHTGSPLGGAWGRCPWEG